MEDRVKSKSPLGNKDSQNDSEEKSNENTLDAQDFLHRLIIPPENKYKSIFDVFVLILVAYSCIQSILNMTFNIEPTDGMTIVFYSVESCFYLDFILSFFQGYLDVEEQKKVFEFRKIAIKYLKGWFVIDFISIFPFHLLSNSNSRHSQVTKLFRLPRMLRMIKLLDINNVKRLLKSFQGEISNANQIVQQYTNLFIYKMIRLVLMLSLCTLFLGCIWFFISS